MCGRFVANIPADELKKIFALIEAPQLEPRFNGAPTQRVAVIRNNGDHNHLDLLKCGRVGSHAFGDLRVLGGLRTCLR